MKVIQDTFHTSVDKHRVIEKITLEEVLAFAEDFRNGCFVQGLVQGNVAQEEAEVCS